MLKTRLGTSRFLQVVASLVAPKKSTAARQPLPGSSDPQSDDVYTESDVDDIKALGDAWSAASGPVASNYDAVYDDVEVNEEDFPYVAPEQVDEQQADAEALPMTDEHQAWMDGPQAGDFYQPPADAEAVPAS